MAETFLYFAYGSNMLSRRLKDEERTPSAKAIGRGFVKGYRLTFDKVSIDKSGKCNIEATTTITGCVHGVLFAIAVSEKGKLDSAEKGYRKKEVEVVTKDEVCVAVAYIADKTSPGLQPYHWYKSFVVAGAEENELPKDYINWLRTVISIPDQNDVRRKKNEELLVATTSTAR